MFKALKKGKRKQHFTFQSHSIPQAVLLTSLVWANPLTTQLVHAENTADNTVELSTVKVEGSGEAGAIPVSKKISTTSTKTTTPLNKTPQAVSVVTSDDIKEKGATSVADSLSYSAGVVTNYRGTSNRNDEVMARGMNSYLPQYLDGISFASGSSGMSIAPQIDPWLLDRVELIHGPASVLYGQSNPGGLISMTSKRPTEESIHEVEFGYGTNNQREAAFDFGGTMSDDGKVLYRLTGIGTAKDGQEKYVEEERYAIAPSVTIKPTDATSVTFLASVQNDPKAGYRNFMPVEGTATANPNGSIPSDFYMSDTDWEKAKRKQTSVGYAVEHKINDQLTARQNLRYTDLKQDTQTLIYWDWADPTTKTTMERQASRYHDEIHTMGVDNQLQFDTKTGAAKHTLLGGVDYKHMTYSTQQSTGSGDSLNLNWLNPDYSLTASDIESTLSAKENSKQTRKQTGVYLQDQVELGRWNFVLSGRNDWADLNLDDYLYSENDATKVHKATGRAGALYAFDNGLSPYVSYSTSFEPITSKGSNGKILKPTTAKQTEVGVKYQPKGSQSSVTVAAFDLHQKDVASYDYTTYSYQQTGEIGSKGLEVESNLHLTDAWKMTTAYAYTDAEILNDETASNVGLVPYWMPKHSGSIWNSYELNNGVTAAAGWRYVGTTYNRSNTMKTAAFGLYDMSVAYDLDKASVKLKGAKVQLTVNNVFDKKYVSSCANDYACFYGSERSAMAKISYAW
jgi:iron complex outermembrane receptor protein